MTDEEMKVKMLENKRDVFESHTAAVAAFCVTYGVPLEKGVELALDILGYGLNTLVISGVYQKVVKKRAYLDTLSDEEIKAMLVSDQEGENEKDKDKDKGDDSIHDAKS